MSDLPTGWAISSLKELLTEDGVFSDGDWVESKDQDPNGSIRLLQLADIGDGYFVDKSCRFINEQKFVELRCTELFENDVLIARMPDPLGRACLMPKLPQRCVTVVDVAVFRAGKGGVSNNWLMHTINAPQYRAEIELNSSGTTRKRISRGNLAAMAMPVAPLPEQKRIVDKLDSVLARVDACHNRLDRLPALLKRFRQSILAAATSGRLTEDWRNLHITNVKDAEWLQTTLSKLCETGRVITYGVIKLGDETPDGVPCLRTSNVRWLDIELNGMKRIAPSLSNEYRRTILQGTEVLVNVRGTLGGVVAATPSMKGWNVSREVAVVPVAPDSAFAKFIELWIASDGSQRWLRKVEKGVAYVGINIEDLRNLPVALPPIDEQTEIVRRVQILFAFADRLEARLATARRQVGQLTPALLAKAFRGELVAQDPADEPAAELLKRLAAQRENAPKAKRGRKITNP